MPVPESLPVSRAAVAGGIRLEDLGLYVQPIRKSGVPIDWARPIREAWTVSESAALQLLREFIGGKMQRYEADRGFADGRCVSKVGFPRDSLVCRCVHTQTADPKRGSPAMHVMDGSRLEERTMLGSLNALRILRLQLSPYLHFGQLSPRQMMAELARANCKQVSKTFWRRLVWRDLAYWQLHHWPDLPVSPVRQHYSGMPWNTSMENLRRDPLSLWVVAGT